MDVLVLGLALRPGDSEAARENVFRVNLDLRYVSLLRQTSNVFFPTFNCFSSLIYPLHASIQAPNRDVLTNYLEKQ